MPMSFLRYARMDFLLLPASMSPADNSLIFLRDSIFARLRTLTVSATASANPGIPAQDLGESGRPDLDELGLFLDGDRGRPGHSRQQGHFADDAAGAGVELGGVGSSRSPP